MMWIIISLLLFFIFAQQQTSKNGIERMRRFSLRFVLGVFLLYIVHILLGRYEIEVSINFFSMGMVTLLGIPGLLTVMFISFIK